MDESENLHEINAEYKVSINRRKENKKVVMQVIAY